MKILALIKTAVVRWIQKPILGVFISRKNDFYKTKKRWKMGELSIEEIT